MHTGWWRWPRRQRATTWLGDGHCSGSTTRAGTRGRAWRLWRAPGWPRTTATASPWRRQG
eukprot:5142618-Lingulodinium_polyedra.AAC.1